MSAAHFALQGAAGPAMESQPRARLQSKDAAATATGWDGATRAPLFFVCSMSEENKGDAVISMNSVKALLAGALAGAMSRTFTSPLERLKVLRQVDTTDAYKGFFRALMRMYKEEGFLSYWKGNGTNVARIAPYSAIQFFAFDQYKRLLINPEDDSITMRLLAGGLAGATSSVACYPLDLVRSHLTVQINTVKYKGMVDGLVKIYGEGGFFGLYKGLGPTLFGIAPYVAINFTVFDRLKRRFLPPPSHPRFDAINLLLGALSGGVAALVTFPTDMLRRRMQLRGARVGDVVIPNYKNSIDCIRHVLRTEGAVGFYKGLIPCLGKVVPSAAIAFSLYERLRHVLKFDPPTRRISAGSM